MNVIIDYFCIGEGVLCKSYLSICMKKVMSEIILGNKTIFCFYA